MGSKRGTSGNFHGCLIFLQSKFRVLIAQLSSTQRPAAPNSRSEFSGNASSATNTGKETIIKSRILSKISSELFYSSQERTTSSSDSISWFWDRRLKNRHRKKQKSPKRAPILETSRLKIARRISSLTREFFANPKIVNNCIVENWCKIMMMISHLKNTQQTVTVTAGDHSPTWPPTKVPKFWKIFRDQKILRFL